MNWATTTSSIWRLAATFLAAGALLLSTGAAPAAGDGFLINCSDVGGPCLGGDNPETIVGTDAPDEIRAMAGNDRVYGGEEMDTIYGGPGKDRLVGELGFDTAYGGAGSDIIAAAADPDGQPMYEITFDYSYGGGGADTIYAIDGYRDGIFCGKGEGDRAYFDAGLDTVDGCEYKHPQLHLPF